MKKEKTIFILLIVLVQIFLLINTPTADSYLMHKSATRDNGINVIKEIN